MMSATPSHPPHEPRRLSDEAWIALDEDEPGELVDGVLVEEEMPDFAHDTTVAFLTWLLMSWSHENGGHVAVSEVKYLIRPGRGRKPDLSMYFPGSRPPPKRGA